MRAKIKIIRGMHLLAIATLLALLHGCTYDMAIKPFDARPLLRKVNMTAGVYYSEDFLQNMQIVQPEPGMYQLKFPVGKASVAMLDRVFSETFDRVVNVTNWPVDATSLPEVDVVVVPNLAHFSVDQTKYARDDRIMDFSPVWWEAWIEYKIKMFLTDGKLLNSHEVLGHGYTNKELYSRRPALVATERAIRDAAAKLSAALDGDNGPARSFRLSPRADPGPSSVESQEQARRVESQEEMVVALARPGVIEDDHEVHVTDCMSKKIQGAIPSVKIIVEDEFREKIFPWLEASTLPDTPEKMLSLFNRPLVRDRLSSLHVGYVIFVSGETDTQEPEHYWGGAQCGAVLGTGGCAGLTVKERKADLKATVFKLGQEPGIVGGTDASARGASWILGLQAPIWHNAKPEAAACERLADKVSTILLGRNVGSNPGNRRSPSKESIQAESSLDEGNN